MHEMYVESLVVPNVDPAAVITDNTPVNLSGEIIKNSETLGLGDPKSDVNLGNDDLGCSDKANVDDNDSENAGVGSVTENAQET
ncbi:hypothetical protein A2U01_0075082, partial [Trifolium medium]|nr:hypothetical protein [Trifolium medium]